MTTTGQEPAVVPMRPEVTAREWGQEIALFGDVHALKVLHRKAGTKGGLQYHAKTEMHYLLSGRLRLRGVRDGALYTQDVESGAAWLVQPGAVHQEEALTDAVVIEASDPTREDRVRVDAEFGQDGGGTLPSTIRPERARILIEIAERFHRYAADCAQRASHLIVTS